MPDYRGSVDGKKPKEDNPVWFILGAIIFVGLLVGLVFSMDGEKQAEQRKIDAMSVEERCFEHRYDELAKAPLECTTLQRELNHE